MEREINEDKTFRNSNITGQTRNDVMFEACSFISCNYSGCHFNNCRFIDCIFTSCDLSMLTLANCSLNNVTFSDCKLLGVNFSNCSDSLFLVRLENSILDYSSFAGKKMMKTHFSNTSLKNTDFTDSDLTRSMFQNCDLLNAIFYGTILKEADLTTAFNYSIDPELNKIKKARFTLPGITGLLNKYDIIIE